MTDHQLLSRIAQSVCLLLTCLVIDGCNSTFTWQEEVLLHDGNKIIVERSETYDSRIPHELDQDAPLAEHRTTFMIPGTNQPVIWKSGNHSVARSELLRPELLLLSLDFLDGVPYVATVVSWPSGYEKWGRPNPPYVCFRYVDGWERIPFDAFPENFKINVLVKSVKHKPYRKKVLEENNVYGFVRAQTIAEINSEPGAYKHFYSIVRTPLDYGPPRAEHKGPKAPNPM